MSGKVSLVRVELPDTINSNVVVSQERKPYWDAPGNGYKYGPKALSFSANTMEVLYLGLDHTKSIGISYNTENMSGSSGILLGGDRNHVDIRMYDVPLDAEIASEGLPMPIEAIWGEFQYGKGDLFDRRIILPIHAGSLSLHMTVNSMHRVPEQVIS